MSWLSDLWSHKAQRVRTLDEELAMTCACRFNAEWPEPPEDLSLQWAYEECEYHKALREFRR